MTHPAVMKASKIANRAVEQGWKGHLDSQMVGGEKYRKTVLWLERNDETLVIDWRNAHFDKATYSMFDSIKTINELPEIKRIVMGYPDVIELLACFKDVNPPYITKTYCRLPFDWQNDDDDTIIAALTGKQVWWYESIAQRVNCDTVLPKGPKRIAPVGHRKLFHFKGTMAGQRSILLDMVLKVS